MTYGSGSVEPGLDLGHKKFILEETVKSECYRVSEDITIGESMKLMTTLHKRCLLLVDNRYELIGYVTCDMLITAIKEGANESDPVKPYSKDIMDLYSPTSDLSRTYGRYCADAGLRFYQVKRVAPGPKESRSREHGVN